MHNILAALKKKQECNGSGPLIKVTRDEIGCRWEQGFPLPWREGGRGEWKVDDCKFALDRLFLESNYHARRREGRRSFGDESRGHSKLIRLASHRPHAKQAGEEDRQERQLTDTGYKQEIFRALLIENWERYIRGQSADFHVVKYPNKRLKYNQTIV